MKWNQKYKVMTKDEYIILVGGAIISLLSHHIVIGVVSVICSIIVFFCRLEWYYEEGISGGGN